VDEPHGFIAHGVGLPQVIIQKRLQLPRVIGVEIQDGFHGNLDDLGRALVIVSCFHNRSRFLFE
jgi:hypothetical protein